MNMDRSSAAQLGQEIVRILKAGRYTNPAREVVEISDLLKRSVEDVRSFAPDHDLPAVPAGAEQTQIEVANESTLAAARRLVQLGLRPVALNTT